MMSPVGGDEIDVSVGDRRLRFETLDGPRESDARGGDDYVSRGHYARTCCVAAAGAVLTVLVTVLVAFCVAVFVGSYLVFESGRCDAGWVGLGYLCIGSPSSNMTPTDGAEFCASSGGEVIDFSVAQELVSALGSFAPNGVDNYVEPLRVRESASTCVKASASGPASVECPPTAAVVCQKTRQLSVIASIIRHTRMFLRLEKPDYYMRHAVVLST
uniref:UL45 protein n=1 Tax=Anatid alphaherpesvirus 2 TaxID=3080522 RepID=A0AAU0K6I7_9ALPH